MKSGNSDVPSEWPMVTLRSVSKRLTDGTHQTPKFQAEGVPFLVIANVRTGKINWDSVKKWVSEDTYEECTRRCRPEQGDVLYTAVGSYGTALEVTTDRRFMFQRHIAHIKPDREVINSAFLALMLNSPQSGKRADAVARGVAQKTVTLGALAQFEVPLPPIDDQHRIVAHVEALTAKSRRAKESLDAIPPLLDRFRQSVVAAAFRGDLTADWRAQHPDVEPAEQLLARIRKERRARWEEAELAKLRAKSKEPKDDGWKAKYKEPEPVDTEGLPELPTGWCWARLEQLTLIRGGVAKGQKPRDGLSYRRVPYLRVANVQRGYLSLDDVADIDVPDHVADDLLLKPGDVLFNEGGDRDKLGRGWIWSGEVTNCIHQNHVFRARPASAEIVPELISWYGNAHGKEYFLAGGKQTTNLASISMSKLSALPVPLAPITEQRELFGRIDNMLRMASRLSMLLSSACSTQALLEMALLTHAFTGRLSTSRRDARGSSSELR